jgi:hypothetical protein
LPEERVAFVEDAGRQLERRKKGHLVVMVTNCVTLNKSLLFSPVLDA